MVIFYCIYIYNRILLRGDFVVGMFDNYENNSYTAYNLTPPSISRGILTNFKTPLYTLNKQGNVDRFFWVEGEHFELKLSAKTKVRVPKGSILFYSKEEKPSSATVGMVGSKCYNVEEFISWTLSSINENPDGTKSYEWIKDDLFECLQDGGEEIELSPVLGDGSLTVKILNFRREVMYEYTSDDIVIISINEEETPELKQGQYFIDLFVGDENTSHFVSEYPVSILGNIDRVADYIKTNNYYTTIKTIHDKIEDFIWLPIEKVIDIDIQYKG